MENTKTSSNSVSQTEDYPDEEPNIEGDRVNYILLSLLYILSGATSGIGCAIPFVLHKRKNVTYEDQAQFNMVWYWFSFKVLWAPIIDSVYWKKLGRRKSWLITMQYSIGILLLIISMNAEDLLGNEDETRIPNVKLLTIIFSVCVLFLCTNSIALEAWSLTLFQKKNIGYTGSCKSIGTELGFISASVGFIVLDSKDFCNFFRSVPQDNGFIAFSDFLLFWSIVYILITTCFFLFKKEESVNIEKKLGLINTYRSSWKILKIPQIQLMAIFLLFCSIAFAPVDSVISLQLMDVGIPGDNLILLSLPALPFELVLTWFLGRYLTGPRTMHSYRVFYVLKFLGCIVQVAFLFWVSSSVGESRTVPAWYYVPLLFISICYSVVSFALTTSVRAIIARISDPRLGAIYTAILNASLTFGCQWPSTVCLWLVDFLTLETCEEDMQKVPTCHKIVGGFYVEVVACLLIGALWMVCWGRRIINKFEKTNQIRETIEPRRSSDC